MLAGTLLAAAAAAPTAAAVAANNSNGKTRRTYGVQLVLLPPKLLLLLPCMLLWWWLVLELCAQPAKSYAAAESLAGKCLQDSRHVKGFAGPTICNAQCGMNSTCGAATT
jgi:hypothetical protein